MLYKIGWHILKNITGSDDSALKKERWLNEPENALKQKKLSRRQRQI